MKECVNTALWTMAKYPMDYGKIPYGLCKNTLWTMALWDYGKISGPWQGSRLLRSLTLRGFAFGECPGLVRGNIISRSSIQTLYLRGPQCHRHSAIGYFCIVHRVFLHSPQGILPQCHRSQSIVPQVIVHSAIIPFLLPRNPSIQTIQTKLNLPSH